MYYGAIKKTDIANGTGVRVTLFVSGCTHHCRGCFQPESWDFQYGSPYTKETEQEILNALDHDYIKGLTLLGGEPFEPENQKVLVRLLKNVRARFPQKDIWCYTGYTYETDLIEDSRARCEVTDDMLSLIDVLVDGEFHEAEKDISLRFRGSKNQRLIDLPKTKRQKNIILLEI
ncbi:MAG: anaerobic ribonucleoside-triphosphate reductase activating protein [Eubacterium sp.]|nr:anaerobic ribonucleoside-triphosphate reductase activating protein [Eubacterium sp.]MCI8918627.1 anaerobic ribonucleoside-triphosphate reductase activating protein [Eubacterium sp.]